MRAAILTLVPGAPHPPPLAFQARQSRHWPGVSKRLFHTASFEDSWVPADAFGAFSAFGHTMVQSSSLSRAQRGTPLESIHSAPSPFVFLKSGNLSL